VKRVSGVSTLREPRMVGGSAVVLNRRDPQIDAREMRLIHTFRHGVIDGPISPTGSTAGMDVR
jgi:hypothetical protein